MPSMSVLPESWKSSMSTVLTALDLSMMVSVPTSSRPTESHGIFVRSISCCTTVRHRELMSSLTEQKPIRVWPKPTVYFPASTLLYFSRSVWSTYWAGKYTSMARIPTSFGQVSVLATGTAGMVENLQWK